MSEATGEGGVDWRVDSSPSKEQEWWAKLQAEVQGYYQEAVKRAPEGLAYHTWPHTDSILAALKNQQEHQWGMATAINSLRQKYGLPDDARVWEALKTAALIHDLGDIGQLEGDQVRAFEKPFTGSQRGRAEARAIEIAQHYGEKYGWDPAFTRLVVDAIAATRYLPSLPDEEEVLIELPDSDNEPRAYRLPRELVRWVQINDQIISYLFPPLDFRPNEAETEAERVKKWRSHQLAGLLREFGQYAGGANLGDFMSFLALRAEALGFDLDGIPGEALPFDRDRVRDWFKPASGGTGSDGLRSKTVADLQKQLGQRWIEVLKKIYDDPPEDLETYLTKILADRHEFLNSKFAADRQ